MSDNVVYHVQYRDAFNHWRNARMKGNNKFFTLHNARFALTTAANQNHDVFYRIVRRTSRFTRAEVVSFPFAVSDCGKLDIPAITSDGETYVYGEGE